MAIGRGRVPARYVVRSNTTVSAIRFGRAVRFAKVHASEKHGRGACGSGRRNPRKGTRGSDQQREPIVVAGPLCESGDVYARRRG